MAPRGPTFSLAARATTSLAAVPARDTLNGGSGNDDLDAGTVLGGPGVDQASYPERHVDIVADLDGAKADDGEAGEHDTLGGDIEKLVGGTGNDALGGSAGNNYISGSYGNDTIVGGGGNDVLDGYYGEGKLSGGAGDDQLWAEPHSNTSTRDEVDGGANHTTLPGDTCSLTDYSISTGFETIQTRPSHRTVGESHLPEAIEPGHDSRPLVICRQPPSSAEPGIRPSPRVTVEAVAFDQAIRLVHLRVEKSTGFC